MDMTINRPKIYDDITKKCLEIFDDGQSLAVDEILMQLMDLPGVPMHDPFHHYIMPAASLVAAAIERKADSSFRRLAARGAQTRKNRTGRFLR